jgi:hypothetical protein
MSRERFDAFVAARGRGRLLGDDLIAGGHLSPIDRKAALVRQTSELVYEALRWRHGLGSGSRPVRRRQRRWPRPPSSSTSRPC